MSDIVIEKISHIEELLVEINNKLDNFIGFEELTEEEKKEIVSIKGEIKKGEFMTMDDVFGD